MKKIYNMKKVISMKRFIFELGENFTDHMKNRLMELEVRCVLTRKEHYNRLEIKHVEHIKYDCTPEDLQNPCEKEAVYGQFIVVDGTLYYSNVNANDNFIMPPIVNTIYNSLDNDGMLEDEFGTAKRIDDHNIDYIIDTILTVFPQVSKSYTDIMAKYK